MAELNMFCFVLNLFITALMGVFMPIVPRLTRKSFLFGVKAPPSEYESAEANILKKRYAGICIAGTAAILALNIVQYVEAPDLTVLGAMYFPFLLAAVQLAAFVPQHKAAKRLKQEKQWRVNEASFADTKTSASRGSLANLPWAWYALSLFAILASTALLFAMYPSMPDRIATHYGFNMEPDAWADKTIGQVLLLPIANLMVLAIILGSAISVEKAKLPLDASDPALSFAQHAAYRRRMGNSLGFLAFCIALMVILIGLPNIISGFRMNFWLLNLIWAVPTVVVCAVAIGSGQSGCLIKITGNKLKNANGQQGQYGSGVPSGSGGDEFWALGLFYHNHDDPSVFVGDRFGGNFGFNYSHIAVKIGLVAFVLPIIAFYAWFTAWWLAFIS